METKDSLEKQVEEFYGIHPYRKVIKFIVGPFGDFTSIRDYNSTPYDKNKEKRVPSKIIEEISKLSGQKFDESKLIYDRVRESYEESKRIPSPSWAIIGLYSKKYKEYHKKCENFYEFERLWEGSSKTK